MSTIIDSIESEQLRQVPRFEAGDRVRVHFQVIEGARTRTQVFEGVVIKRQGSGIRETFTVRKQSFGVGVERTFPVHSPKIGRLEVAARGDVRRAKLYYLRDRVGKAARVAERRWGITEDVLASDEAEGAVDSEGTSQAEADVEVVEAEGDGDQPTPEDAAADDEASAEDRAEAEEAPAEPDANAEGDSDENAEADPDASAEADPDASADTDPDASADESADESGGEEESGEESRPGGDGEAEAPERDG